MKKAKTILNQGLSKKSLKKEERINLGQRNLTLNKKKFIDAIDALFLKLELAYHYQFYKVFGTDQRLSEGKKLWASSLKKFSSQVILDATDTVVESQPYLPTLTDLIKACNDISSIDGFPSVEEAYIEARKSYSPRQEYKWSHPIVYFSGKKIGWNLMDEKDSKELFHAFSKIYSKLKKDALSGSDFSLPRLKNDEEMLTPLNPSLLEKLRKKHNI